MYDRKLMPFKFPLLAALTFLSNLATAQTHIFPLSEVRAGQRGFGQTVFSGARIERFDVEILGVLHNAGPGQNVILARLSGGPLEKTGVMQGMSGSPVYIDGRLAGAVALAFPFSKEPIAGIRPVEEMLRAGLASPAVKTARAAPAPAGAPAPKLIDIATPVSFRGFASSALDYFSPRLRALGMEPSQGVSSGGAIPRKLGDPSKLHPGDMISVELLSGDLSVGADGTVTAVDGNRVFAFGHQFLGAGTTDLPFARSSVIAVLPSVNASFKISSPVEWMGTITQDRSAAIAGELGRRAATVPFTIRIHGPGGAAVYRMEMVSDRVLSPLLAQMAVYSAIAATERSIGAGAYEFHGQAEFGPGIPPLRLDNAYAGDAALPPIAALGVSSPLSYALASDFDALRLSRIDLDIRASEEHRLLDISQVTASRAEANPGDGLDVFVTFTGRNGDEVRKTVHYTVPVGAPPGPLQFAVTEAAGANLEAYQRLLVSTPRSPRQVIEFLNALRDNRKAYLRVLRSAASFTVRGNEMPDPPPSLALILTRMQQPSTMPALAAASKLAEFPIDAGGDIVSGSQSVTVQVKQ